MPRKQHKYHYLYKTTNLKNGKFYVGMHSSNDLEDGYLGSGLRIRRSIKKYGKENFKFEILEFFDNKEKLSEAERNLVNKDFIKEPLCMNLKEGGSGGFTKENSLKGTLAMNKKNWSDPEFRKRNSNRMKVQNKQLFELGILKAPDWTGKTHTAESIQLMSEKAQLRVGDKNSQFGTCWIYNDKESKKIKKEELNSHLSNGWIKGRKMQW
jgi:hypothetical protein